MSDHKIICGDVIPVLKSLPDEHVDMLMTSVPYWGLRDYGEDTATVWGGDMLFKCNKCQSVIRINRYDRKDVRILREAPRIKKEQDGTGLQSEMRGDVGDKRGAMASPESAKQFWRSQHELERGEKDARGICVCSCTSRPPSSRETKRKEALYSGASPCDGETFGETSEKLGESTPQEWYKSGQQNKELGNSDTCSTCGQSNVPFLPKVVQRSLKCPACDSNDLIEIDCEHEWQQHYQPRKGGKNLSENPPNVRADIATQSSSLRNGDINTQFCSKCGAWHGQLGLEPSPELYIEHLRLVFVEVKRVLKKTGTCWVNIGDTYASGKSRYNSSPHTLSGKERDEPTSWNKPDLYKEGYEDTCLCLIPELFLIMMVFDLDFILRNKNVWKKDNPMPSSVKNRFNNVWEPVYFFTKNNKPVYFYNDKTGDMVNKKPTSQIEGVDWDWKEVGVVDENTFNVRVRDAGLNRFLVKATEEETGVYGKSKLKKRSHWRSVDYFFDLDAVREPYTEPLNRWGGIELKANGKSYWDEGTGQEIYRDRNLRPNKLGKNPGDFWNINTEPYPDAHFATFPRKLVEKPILAGCPAEVCKHCGMARVRITNRTGEVNQQWGERKSKPWFDDKREMPQKVIKEGIYETIGWTDCPCSEENKYEPGIIIDIFAGSGTVGIVAEKHGRSSILIDIKKDYCEMAFKRLKPLVEQTDLSGKQSTIKKEGF